MVGLTLSCPMLKINKCCFGLIDAAFSPSAWQMGSGSSSLDQARHHMQEHSDGTGSVDQGESHGKDHLLFQPVEPLINFLEILVDGLEILVDVVYQVHLAHFLTPLSLGTQGSAETLRKSGA